MNDKITLLTLRHCHSHLFRWWWWLTAHASQAHTGKGSVSGQRCTLLTFRYVQGDQFYVLQSRWLFPKERCPCGWSGKSGTKFLSASRSPGRPLGCHQQVLSVLPCKGSVHLTSEGFKWPLITVLWKPIVYTSRWQVCVWAWSLTQAWHDDSVPEMYLGNKNL